MEKNRIALEGGTIATGGTQVDVKGALEDLAAPHAKLQYQARVGLADIARIFRVPELRAGRATVDGSGEWAPGSGLALTGAVHASGVEYRDDALRLVDFRGDGMASVSTRGVFANNLRVSLLWRCAKRQAAGSGAGPDRQFEGCTDRDIEIGGVALNLLGGTFRGEAKLGQLDHYAVKGELSGVNARRTVAMYSTEPLPWDALVFGSVSLDGSLKHGKELRAGGNLQLAPAPASEPVRGQLQVAYEARNGSLDVGRSTVSLPHSRVDFSGSLNSELKVHLETGDLNDLLPALGQSVATLPVKLGSGRAQFDGSVTGNLSNPRIAGHLTANNFTVSDQHVNSVEGDVNVSADYLAGVLKRDDSQ